MAETETATGGKWKDAAIPKSGWRFSSLEDNGETWRLCEMCETRHIRFAHVMRHHAYPGTLEVGCVCAGKMQGNAALARRRERERKNALLRRERWLQRAWRVSRKGSAYLNTRDGFNVAVYRVGEGWGARVLYKPSEVERRSKRIYRTADDAKLAAFDQMERMLATDEL